MIKENKEALYESYADIFSGHERRPGVGPLAGFREKIKVHLEEVPQTIIRLNVIKRMAVFGVKKFLWDLNIISTEQVLSKVGS